MTYDAIYNCQLFHEESFLVLARPFAFVADLDAMVSLLE